MADLLAVFAAFCADMWQPGPGHRGRHVALMLLFILIAGSFTWSALYFDWV